MSIHIVHSVDGKTAEIFRMVADTSEVSIHIYGVKGGFREYLVVKLADLKRVVALMEAEK